jgi:hypothetical protein
VFRLEDLAWIYVVTGHHDLALEKLAHLVSVPGEITRVRLSLDPKWDSLRELAGFRALLADTDDPDHP